METTQKEQQRKQRNLQEFRVEILTPYLSEGIESFMRGDFNPIREFMTGYDPFNLSGVSEIKTKKHIIKIHSPEYTVREGILGRHFNETAPEADFVIASSTENGEKEVERFKGSGLLIARYSIFYGKPSGYSHLNPECGGYAFDLPKAVPAAVTLITDSRTIDAILERDAGKIRNAIAKLNKGKENCPIIVTPYLEEALKYIPRKQEDI